MNAYLLNYFSTTLLVVILLAAAVSDLRSQRIPNSLTLTTIVGALLYYFVLNGVNGLIFSTLGLLTGTGLLMVPYLMGGMGAGDAKLMGAVGAVVGARGVFISFLLAALIGGLYALLVMVRKRDHFKGFLHNQLITFKLLILTGKIDPHGMVVSRKRPKLCYGLAIALGSIAYMALDLTGFTFPI